MSPFNEINASEHCKRKIAMCFITGRLAPMDREYHCRSENEATSRTNEATPEVQGPQSSCDDIEKYKCKFCNKGFARKNNMERHVRRHTGERPFGCPECGSRFSHKSTLLGHLNLHTGDRPYICDMCQKTFRQRSSYTTHRKIHTTERIHACEDCGKQFIQKNSLKLHLLVHSGEKPFVCKHCDKTFTHSSLLKQHSEIHKEDSERKIYICNVCDKKFCKKLTLELHLKAHAGIKDFDCKKCGKTFQHRSALNRHVRQSEYACIGKCKNRERFRERGYECNYCTQRFKTKQILRNHIISHTGEKPFECKDCSTKFTVQNSLKRHLKLHCKGKTECQDNHNSCSVHTSTTCVTDREHVMQSSSNNSQKISSHSNSLDLEDKKPVQKSTNLEGNSHNPSIPSITFISLVNPMSAINTSPPCESMPVDGVERLTQQLSISEDKSFSSVSLSKNPSDNVALVINTQDTIREFVENETEIVEGNLNTRSVGPLSTECQGGLSDNEAKDNSSSKDFSMKEEIDIVYEDIDEELWSHQSQ